MANSIIDFLVNFSPAIAGGIVKYFHDISRNGHKFEWKKFALQIIMAGFVGFITLSLIADMVFFSTRPNLQGAIVGVSSYLSAQVLLIIENRIPNKIDDAVKKL